jgi:uncharacterized tellurite resistance protein B-like protein
METLELFEDFILFLFIHVARADGSLHPNERDVILQKMSEIISAEANWAQRLEDMDRKYTALGVTAAETLLKDSLSRFAHHDPAVRSRIHQAVYDIVNANGQVHAEEIKTLRVFKNWLTSA